MKPWYLSIILAVVLLIAACAGTPQTECLQRVAATEVAITEGYESIVSLLEADIVDADTARQAEKAIDAANLAADSAGRLCAIDEPSALDYISTAGAAILKANEILGR